MFNILHAHWGRSKGYSLSIFVQWNLIYVINCFPDGKRVILPNGYDDWTTHSLRHSGILLRSSYFIIELTKMLRRSPIKCEATSWGLTVIWKVVGSICLTCWITFTNCPKLGIVSVLNTQFSEQHTCGYIIKSQNVLEVLEVRKLYNSSHLSKNTPKSFVNRVLFVVTLVNAIPTTQLQILRLFKVARTTPNGKTKICTSGVVGFVTGTVNPRYKHGIWKKGVLCL